MPSSSIAPPYSPAAIWGLGCELAVDHLKHPVTVLQDIVIVGHHDHGHIPTMGLVSEEGDDLMASLAV